MNDTPENIYSEDPSLYESSTGFTVAIFFPPNAPRTRVDEFLSRISVLAHDGFFPNRKTWDPFVIGYAGDVLHIDTDEHVYLSTGCLHGSTRLPDGRTGHQYCRSETGVCGQKAPGACKVCGTPCICSCHMK